MKVDGGLGVNNAHDSNIPGERYIGAAERMGMIEPADTGTMVSCSMGRAEPIGLEA
jgi:hypothetical protein